jgi:SAM-dependent methyltransferase
MSPHEVAASYDNIAERWLPEQFGTRDGIEQHRRALAFLGQPYGRALDVGCGANGSFFSLFREHGLEPEGLDLSGEMLRLARLRFPDLRLHQADICEWAPDRHYAFITAWDSIWHVPLKQQESVLRKLCSWLERGGVLIFSAGGTDRPDERRDAYMGVPMYHASLGVPEILRVLAETGCNLRHFEYDQRPQAHVFFIIQRLSPHPPVQTRREITAS